MYRFAAFVALVPLCASPPAAAWVSPDAFVAGVYRQERGGSDAARVYAREVAAALATAKDQPDFDWRFDAQDAEITDLSFVETAGGPDGSLIEARFRNFGEEVVLDWTLCRRDNGDWRVVDVTSHANGWSLRALLKLPPEATDC